MANPDNLPEFPNDTRGRGLGDSIYPPEFDPDHDIDFESISQPPIDTPTETPQSGYDAEVFDRCECDVPQLAIDSDTVAQWTVTIVWCTACETYFDSAVEPIEEADRDE